MRWFASLLANGDLNYVTVLLQNMDLNKMDTFKYAIDDKFIDKLIGRMDQNQEIFEKVLED